mmetsp:Transcript_102588/g.185046  ORF Transcript_102588/g.185046 Transcript_102588/m.185046 type:complete len:97 (+) Transcript_102588:441-731(+)
MCTPRKKEPSKSRARTTTWMMLGSCLYHLLSLSQRIAFFAAGSLSLDLVGYSSTQLISKCRFFIDTSRGTLRCYSQLSQSTVMPAHHFLSKASGCC